MGFSRQEYWSGLPFLPLGNFSWLRVEPASLISPVLAGGFFTSSTTWKALFLCSLLLKTVWWNKYCALFNLSEIYNPVLCELLESRDGWHSVYLVPPALLIHKRGSINIVLGISSSLGSAHLYVPNKNYLIRRHWNLIVKKTASPLLQGWCCVSTRCSAIREPPPGAMMATAAEFLNFMLYQGFWTFIAV